MSQSTHDNTKTIHPCHSMDDVRHHIDALDQGIVALLAQRSAYVAQAARIKQDASQIVDEERIEFIIGRVRTMAQEKNLSPEVAERTYRAMIAAFIDFERSEFARQHTQT